MFGIRYIRVHPTDYLIHYKRGRIIREGKGLSFFYFRPTSSLVLIPLATTDVPFIFQAVTSDFQDISLQGQLTYRISDPQKTAGMMDFSLSSDGASFATEDPQKLSQRLVNTLQDLTRSRMKTLTLRDALNDIDGIALALSKGMKSAELINTLGVEILGLSLLAVKPTPETARALEAEAREQIQREADLAIYARRNAAVEQERAIKENELNTEIAVENKKRQIRETQMEADKSVQLKKRELEESRMQAQISLEKMNQDLTKFAAQNAHTQADARAYALTVIIKALKDVDPRNLQSLTQIGMDSSKMVAMAFRELAENTEKIGQLNISPELLQSLLTATKTRE